MRATSEIYGVPLSSLADINPSRLTGSLQPSDEVSFIPMGDVSESGRWLGNQTRRLSEVQNGFTCFAEGDVLFAKITPCMENGKGCLATGLSNSVGFGSTEFHVLRAKNHSDAGYIYQWSTYQDLRKAARNSMTGSAGQQRVPADFFEKFLVPAPPKSEQTKIAEILSTVDRAISQTEALIAKQQRLKTGLMQDLLTRGIDEHGNLRSEQTHQFKDSPLGRIPVEWEVKRLGSLLANINQGWSPDCEADAAAQGEWGILKTTAVVWEGYQDHENKELPRILTPRPHLEIQAGDLLMTRAGPNSRVGVIAYVYCTRSKLMLSDKIYRLVPTKEAEGRFLCYSLSSSGSQRHLSNLKTGMAESQTNISQEIVKALMTVCPPSAEQSLIADRLDHISGESNKSTTVLSKLRALKTALMQDLLTGRKRVTDLLDKTEEAA
ncbi:MAG: restriction endonuclease subunit S [Verrucomicrobiaceae bacterium]|nr:MAG: restriction endonuclease subunit S [Verrucomicrobiaceae bacterium]